jgi:hypothetical protein
LESIENQVAYPTFHFEFIEDIDEIRTTEHFIDNFDKMIMNKKDVGSSVWRNQPF